MRPRRIFALFGLIAVFAASCAPQATPPPASAPVLPPQATQSPETDAPPQVLEPTSQPVVEPTAVFVPRGDKLEATDPATVSLASGGIQLVEFFRFT